MKRVSEIYFLIRVYPRKSVANSSALLRLFNPALDCVHYFPCVGLNGLLGLSYRLVPILFRLDDFDCLHDGRR